MRGREPRLETIDSHALAVYAREAPRLELESEEREVELVAAQDAPQKPTDAPAPLLLGTLAVTSGALQLCYGRELKLLRAGSFPGTPFRHKAVRVEPGTYELVCFLPGHYAAGQKLAFEVAS